MTDLLTGLRAHDLPPRWDGLAVVWDGWHPQLPAFICPPPKLPDCCRRCGSITQAVINRGRVARVPAVTHDAIEAADDRRDRLPTGERHRIKAKALLRLYAFRCPDCKHDQVLDIDSNELWDLDDTDYGDDGSTFDPVAHRAGLVQATRDAIRPTRAQPDHHDEETLF